MKVCRIQMNMQTAHARGIINLPVEHIHMQKSKIKMNEIDSKEIRRQSRHQ